ncbi:flagellar motor protein MotB [Gilvimarinus agarilyticus]|uniref:flagellar motor protein MotB n=1 Tax=unclassified Gilvimarinus TaxID=2642066 RepID=UPI001C0A20DD|nr:MULTISPECIES: flagellar motor protein MotB [unclassified Gilvimarinus]MBU2885324.1 flagellar motor protein MotB [Gilvimarinus agarilyticus]MDO6570223.1 flagellar motor protein MotB [Gilvimarinus sp. 2_MG-2023]MDO6748218.1 flagellar motor protein MotB [Gilvimarinus sp. 1_MG-2023]
MDEEENECECPPGLPAWLATFGDLMSLLMCFFVLLLSFSEMDAMKFRRLAGSLAQAFGVQAQINVNEIPKGTSIIAQEFSPGKPDPTPITEIYQRTQDITKMSLEVRDAEEYDIERGEPNVDDSAKDRLQKIIEGLVEQTRQDAAELASKLEEQIANGELEIETEGRQIIIRIREKGSFESGSARLAPDYYDVIDEIRAVLMLKPGRIQVQGHTDSVPISSSQFRSNWDLSAMRAASVASQLMRGGYLQPGRFEVSGFADVRPLAANDSAASRARNRRVEIVIRQGLQAELAPQDMELLQEEGDDIIRNLDIEPQYLFDLDPEEVF